MFKYVAITGGGGGGSGDTTTTSANTRYGYVTSSKDNLVSSVDVLASIDIEKLWEKMYTKARSMFVACGYCNSVNVFENPSCCQCGGELGSAKVIGENKLCP